MIVLFGLGIHSKVQLSEPKLRQLMATLAAHVHAYSTCVLRTQCLLKNACRTGVCVCAGVQSWIWYGLERGGRVPVCMRERACVCAYECVAVCACR